ncbi:MAG: 4Fe-4S binding protein [Firmicutes bacterium]|nr:4Fe-4S binding protein [Bacillota bacterium]
MLKEVKARRRKLQSWTWLGLPLVVAGGWFYPPLGFLLFGCMAGAAGIALRRGRAWCDWMCPRGSFYDLFFSKISPKKKIPPLLRTKAFRILMLAMIFIVLGGQLYFAWGDANRMGLAMVRVLTVTTALGIVLALAYHPRTWCHICPMGTLGNWLAKGKEPLVIGGQCTACKACSRACPMQLNPAEFRPEGVMGDNDCIKCATCVAACPQKALRFGNAAGDTGVEEKKSVA